MTLEVWAEGEAYELYVGRWSRLVAARYLDWLNMPAGLAWLDLGCGTGALSQAILSRSDPARLVGIDRSTGFLRTASRTTEDERAWFAVSDGGALPIRSGALDTAVSGLMLNFASHPADVVAEMGRAVKPGGTVSAYVWDYAGRMDFMRVFWQEAAALRPAAAELDEGKRFPLCQPVALEALFRGAGLADVAVDAVDVTTTFRDFDDYWSPFLGGQGPAPTYVASLGDNDRKRLRDRIRGVLAASGHGSIELIARAWAVRGRTTAQG